MGERPLFLPPVAKSACGRLLQRSDDRVAKYQLPRFVGHDAAKLQKADRRVHAEHEFRGGVRFSARIPLIEKTQNVLGPNDDAVAIQREANMRLLIRATELWIKLGFPFCRLPFFASRFPNTVTGPML
jgi:hypothetical protein